MKDILEKAKEYWLEIAKRAIAHEDSAEWHRHRGIQLGVVATILSAVVGSSIFATVASQLGKGDSIRIVQGSWSSLIYFGIGFCLILAPVLTGIQTYLNDQEQADKHRQSAAGYYHLQQRLDVLQLRYRDVNATQTSRDEALKELEDVAKEIEVLRRNSITLTDRALTRAEVKLQKPEASASNLSINPPGEARASSAAQH